MTGNGLLTVLTVPGVGDEFGAAVSPAASNTGKPAEERVYKIPPVVWMFVFLIAGYVGVRMILED